MTLDRIDFAIVSELQKNARLSNKELAGMLDIAQSTCLERVRRLREEGVLIGFHAEVDPKALGIGLQALIAIRLTLHSHEMVDSFQAHALSLEEVVSVYHVAGTTDFMVHVAVRDAEHLRNLALDAFTTRPEVDHIQTSLIFAHTRSPVLPQYRT